MQEKIVDVLALLACRVVLPAVFAVLILLLALPFGYGTLFAVVLSVAATLCMLSDAAQLQRKLRYWLVAEGTTETPWRWLGGVLARFVVLYVGVPLLAIAAAAVADRYYMMPSVVGIGAAVIAYLVAIRIVGRGIREPDLTSYRIVGGTKLMTGQEAVAESQRMCEREPASVFWGGMDVPLSVVKGQFCVVGSSDSGKTVTMRLAMQSVLPSIKPGSHRRALVYDPKGDMLPLLRGMDLSCDVKTLNPLDKDGCAWDVAADVTDASTVASLAEVLVPEDNDIQPFFPRSARAILRGVLTLFVKRAKSWTLADVVLALDDLDLLQKMFKSEVRTRPLVAKYFETGTTFQNTMATLDTIVSDLAIPAACWSIASDKVSLRSWVNGSYILHIPRNDDLRGLDRINRALVERASRLLLSGPEVEHCKEGARPESWIFVDEAPGIGKIDSMEDLVLKGRSKGVYVMLGLQNLPAMSREYKKEGAKAILGTCGNKCFLRLSCEETAKWASELFGEFEAIDTDTSTSTSVTTGGSSSGSRQESQTFSHRRNRRMAVMPSDFLNITPPSDAGGIEGYYITWRLGKYRHVYQHAPRLGKPKGPAVEQRDSSAQEIKDSLNDEDLKRLGFPELVGGANQVRRKKPGKGLGDLGLFGGEEADPSGDVRDDDDE